MCHPCLGYGIPLLYFYIGPGRHNARHYRWDTRHIVILCRDTRLHMYFPSTKNIYHHSTPSSSLRRASCSSYFSFCRFTYLSDGFGFASGWVHIGCWLIEYWVLSGSFGIGFSLFLPVSDGICSPLQDTSSVLIVCSYSFTPNLSLSLSGCDRQ